MSPADPRPLSRKWIREIDRRAIEDCGMTGLVLMENAARGAVDVLMRLGYRDAFFGICCGKGNNGGDGFAIARHLDGLGAYLHVLVFCDPNELKGDAAANFAILQKCNVPMYFHSGPHDDDLFANLLVPDVIVDCLLGTGATGDPKAPLDSVIQHMNDYKEIVAIDVPSGLDCDTGEPSKTTIRARNTITFVAPKIGFANPNAEPFVGLVHVVDIGVPRKLLSEIYAEAYR